MYRGIRGVHKEERKQSSNNNTKLQQILEVIIPYLLIEIQKNNPFENSHKNSERSQDIHGI